MPGFGLVNAGGLAGGDTALKDLITERLKQEAVAREVAQQQSENAIRARQMSVSEANQRSLEQDRTDRLAETARNNQVGGALRTLPLLKPKQLLTPDTVKNFDAAGLGSFHETQLPQVAATQYQGTANAPGGIPTAPGLRTGPAQKAVGSLRTVSTPAQAGGEVFTGTALDDQKAAELDAKQKLAEATMTEKQRALDESVRYHDLLNQVAQGNLSVAQLRVEMAGVAAQKKASTLTLSAPAKSAKAAIETAGPLTDQVIAMIEKEAPDIATNPQKYNTMGAKGTSLLQTLKYKAGFYDETDPRQQIVSLLQPIQAGQYTRSSRSRQMLDLALKHMADPSQTLLTQYQRAKELKSIMPEMLEGIVRGEQPVDPSNPLGGSYFQPATPQGPTQGQEFDWVNGQLVPKAK